MIQIKKSIDRIQNHDLRISDTKVVLTKKQTKAL